MSGEASSIAGTQRLGNLVLIYDDNAISIEDNTEIAFTEDVAARYEAYGWHVQTVDWTHGGTTTARTRRTSRPCTTRSSRPSASPTGRASSSSARSSAGRPPTSRTPSRPTATPSVTPRWPRPRRSSASTRPRASRYLRPSSSTPARRVERGQAARAEWQTDVRRVVAQAVRRRRPLRAAPDPDPPRPAGTPTCRPSTADEKGLATRKACGEVINAIAPKVPELWGGSADLAESNNTTIEGALSFLPKDRSAAALEGRPVRRPGAALRRPRARAWARS